MTSIWYASKRLASCSSCHSTDSKLKTPMTLAFLSLVALVALSVSLPTSGGKGRASLSVHKSKSVGIELRQAAEKICPRNNHELMRVQTNDPTGLHQHLSTRLRRKRAGAQPIEKNQDKSPHQGLLVLFHLDTVRRLETDSSNVRWYHWAKL